MSDVQKPHSEPEVFWLTVEGYELDEPLVRKSAYDGLLEQLERAEKFIAHQGMEYRFAEWYGGVANPASEPKENHSAK